MAGSAFNFNVSSSQPPVEVTGTSQQMQGGLTYIANGTSRVYLTLPSSISAGQTIVVNGKGTGGWRIVQNSGQVIRGNSSTTVGVEGYIESTNTNDTIGIRCVTDNTEFVVIARQGAHAVM